MEPINEKETELLKQLREKISDLDLDDEFLDDKCLIRWIRARNWKVSDAELMIRKHIQFRKDENVDTVLDWKYPLGWKKEFPWKITGFDSDGNPVIVEQTGRWDAKKTCDAGMKSEILRMNLNKLESLWGLVKYVSRDKKQLAQGIAIVDLEGLSLRQINSLDAVDAGITTLRHYEANYPESVKHIVILNASWIFKLGWKFVRPFCADRTYSKLKFLGTDRKEWRETLLEIIPEDQFPKYYGGSLDDNKEIRVAKDGSWMYHTVGDTDDSINDNTILN